MRHTLPDPFRLTVRVLHLAMMASVVIYGVVAWVISAQTEAPTPVDPALVIAMIVAALGALVASLWVPGLVVPEARVKQAMQRARDAEAGGAPAGEVSKKTLMAGAQLLMTPFILRLALTEVVALCGLVLSLISAVPWYAVGFGAVALVFMGLAGFDEERLRRLGQRL